MAEYIKFRLTAAKVGVSMALMALIAGIAEKVHGGPQIINSRPAAQVNFQKIRGINTSLKDALVSEEKTIFKLTSEFKSFSTQAKIFKQDIQKIDNTDGSFLTITDGNKWLTIADANQQFGALTNSLEALSSQEQTLSNQLNGDGRVISGAVTAPGDGSSHQILSGDGITASITNSTVPGSGQSSPSVTLQNNTGALLPAVMMVDGQMQPAGTLTPNGGTITIPSSKLTEANNNAHEIQVQIFPGGDGGFGSVVSLIIAVEPNPGAGGGVSAGGQMLLGNL